MIAMSVASTAAALPAPNRYIITFDARAKQPDREAALKALDVTASRFIATDGDTDHEISFALVDLPPGQTLPTDFTENICQDPKRCSRVLRRIIAVEKDRRFKWIESSRAALPAPALPSLPSVMEDLDFLKGRSLPQTPMAFSLLAQRGEEPWGIKRVHASSAWAVCAHETVKTCEGAGVKVAVVDTGIDATHPDLLGKVDGGYSAIAKTENPSDYKDDNGHGTHVSGTIAAIKDAKGVVGVAPSARLYAVKVLDAEGSGSIADVVDGIVWVAKNRMDIANMSLGIQSDSDAIRRAIRSARGAGVVVVAAAGNTGGEVSYPGALEDVITVSASDYEDKLAPFSGRGPAVDFIAPGVDIISDKMGGGIASYSGTSMAAPHVSGLAAIAIAQGYVGLYGPDGVMTQLKKAAVPLPKLSKNKQGAGMIDAGKLAR